MVRDDRDAFEHVQRHREQHRKDVGVRTVAIEELIGGYKPAQFQRILVDVEFAQTIAVGVAPRQSSSRG